MRYELIEFGELKRELEIIDKVETALMIVMFLCTIGLVLGYAFSPVIFLISAVVYFVTFIPYVFVSSRASTLRISVSIRRNSLHIED